MPKPKNTYVVKGGDNLSKIAKEVYGDPRMFAEIQRNNPWFNGVLRPGQVLKLPAKRSNPFVSNTEAAAAGMLGGTAETGYGFTGERAGELNALSQGVRETGRQINPNTPWGFNQASDLARQYYGGAGSQVGAPPPAPASPTAAQQAAKPPASTQQQAQGQGMQQQYFNQAQQATQPQTPSVVSAPGRGWGSPLQNAQSAPQTSTFAQGGAKPGVMPSINPAPKPYTPTPQTATTGAGVGVAPQAVSQPDIYQHGSYQVNQERAAALYPALQTGPDGKLGAAAPKAISGSDFANLAMQTGIPMHEAAQNLMTLGYQYDPGTTSFFMPDKALGSYGVSGFGMFGSGGGTEFAGLPPVTPPSGYGPPRPVYSNAGRQQSGLSLPPMAETGTQSASWNIGP